MAKRRKSTKNRLGELPPRYSFALNPYKETRFSRCPKCKKLNHLRKFPLLIHINGFGPIVLGKTCRYCSKCEFIIAHQDEIDRELTALLLGKAPQVIGNDYYVLGTVEKKAWRQGLQQPGKVADTFPHLADIKDYWTLNYEPARWVPADNKKA